eukprot:2835633-Rhodomonas_salina.1
MDGRGGGGARGGCGGGGGGGKGERGKGKEKNGKKKTERGKGNGKGEEGVTLRFSGGLSFWLPLRNFNAASYPHTPPQYHACPRQRVG